MVKLKLANRTTHESDKNISSSLGQIVSQLYLLNVSICLNIPENTVTIIQFDCETFKKIVLILFSRFIITEFYFDGVTPQEVTTTLDFLGNFMQVEEASIVSKDDSPILTFNCSLETDTLTAINESK